MSNGDDEGPFVEVARPKWRIDRRISIGNIIVLIVLAATLLNDRFNIGNRVTNLENENAAQATTLVNLNKSVENLTQSVKIMQEIDRLYPPHIHPGDKNKPIEAPPRRDPVSMAPDSVGPGRREAQQKATTTTTTVPR